MSTTTNTPFVHREDVAEPVAQRAAEGRSDPALSNGSSAPLEILIDGLCPLCAKEAKLLEWLDGDKGRLKMTDIAAEDFDASRYGKTFEEVMGEIHAVMPDGTLITGVEVFRQAYSRIGWGWLLGWTRWPVFNRIADAGYRWFAKNRLKLTGHGDRCNLDPDQPGRCKV